MTKNTYKTIDDDVRAENCEFKEVNVNTDSNYNAFFCNNPSEDCYYKIDRTTFSKKDFCWYHMMGKNYTPDDIEPKPNNMIEALKQINGEYDK